MPLFRGMASPRKSWSGLHSAVPFFEAKRPAQGEGHGFRGATAIRRALDGELYFYGKVRPNTEKQD